MWTQWRLPFGLWSHGDVLNSFEFNALQPAKLGQIQPDTLICPGIKRHSNRDGFVCRITLEAAVDSLQTPKLKAVQTFLATYVKLAPWAHLAYRFSALAIRRHNLIFAFIATGITLIGTREPREAVTRIEPRGDVRAGSFFIWTSPLAMFYQKAGP